MTKLIPLSSLFEIKHGHKLDLNKMEVAENSDRDAVAFVSRTSKNLGVVAKVKRIESVDPAQAGLITVTLGGTYLLSSFVQEEPFYTAQNIAILTPLATMTLSHKLFYCICLAKNRFKFSAFGREANRTLKSLLVPATVPSWVDKIELRTNDAEAAKPHSATRSSLNDRRWKWFKYDELFEIKKGDRILNNDMEPGSTPCIRPIEFNNGVYDYIDLAPNHEGNTITVSYNGSVAEAFYQDRPYFALDDINVLYPRFALNAHIAMFLVALIRKEKFRYSYGRKWNLGRMKQSVIKLPVTAREDLPDWSFMEHYIQGLPYSKEIAI